MNKSAIKNFAVRARNRLIEDITQKAYELGITINEIKDIETFEGGFKIKGLDNSKTYKKYEAKQREKLVSKIREKGFEQVIEEVAYTWFNRFIALRFMEINEYLPTGVRVLSSIEEGKTEPDIIKEALNIDLDIDKELVYKLIDENDTEDLYKYLIIKQCNQLGEIMPMVFEEISDYTELLLSDNLLAEGSVIRDLVESIEEDDYKDQVEIIGWMYQYYITDINELVYNGNMSKERIPKELLPAATQLFTPDWPVRYMVENSLGRLWLDEYPDKDLKEKWEYYLKELKHSGGNDTELSRNNALSPEDIKVLDPCMGSGHILVYAFDVLYDIYLKSNYSERDIPQLILEKNLYGLDIDNRASQLAAFALMMKARSKNRRIFRKKINLNICSIKESNGITKEVVVHLASKFDGGNKEIICKDVEYIIEVFKDAKEYGSILDVDKVNFDVIEKGIEEVNNEETVDLFEWQYKGVILERLLPLIKQAKIMSEKYEVVITNPPYLGSARMGSKLSEYISNYYSEVKSDLSMVMYKRVIDGFIKDGGYVAFITTTSWMVLKSFEKIREYVLKNLEFESLVDFGTELFDGKVGHNSIVAWINKKVEPREPMIAIRLTEYCYSQREQKKVQFFNLNNRFLINQEKFLKIPGIPIAYSMSENILAAFNNGKIIESFCSPKQGLATADNNRFLRYWHEVKSKKICFNAESREESKKSGCKWFPYNKGGGFRKWYGNNEYVINWENDGLELRNYKGSVLRSPHFYFKECLSWSKITSGKFSMRYIPSGYLFDVAGCSLFTDKDKLDYMLAYLNSKPNSKILSIISPTLNYEVGHIASLPIIFTENNLISSMVQQNISISKSDWDSFETSWDFKLHPLLRYSPIKNNLDTITLEQAFNRRMDYTNKEINKLKENEEKLNRIFIDIYGLQDELTPEVEDKDISINKADKERDIKSFISYAIGCMVGRYSLDQEGLVYAGGHFDINKYKIFIPTKDNILIIADDEYFEDDIVSRFVEFVKITFGENTLEENLNYIAETLGNKLNETSRQTIRRYFLKDFYNDHIKTYSKRPIYWLFDSGKQNGFKALIYIHRYDVSTVARVRTDYLHKLQKKYEAEAKRLDILIESDLSAREKAAAMKKKDSINKQIIECIAYDQVIAHIANQKIDIDLDDGVKVNYDKFQEVKIPQGEGKKPLKANLLAKI